MAEGSRFRQSASEGTRGILKKWDKHAIEIPSRFVHKSAGQYPEIAKPIANAGHGSQSTASLGGAKGIYFMTWSLKSRTTAFKLWKQFQAHMRYATIASTSS